MSTLLAETFGKLVLHFGAQVDYGLIEEHDADVVLSVVTERRLMEGRVQPED